MLESQFRISERLLMAHAALLGITTNTVRVDSSLLFRVRDAVQFFNLLQWIYVVVVVCSLLLSGRAKA